MKKAFFLSLLLVFSLTTAKAFAQAPAEAAKPAAEAAKPAAEAAKPAAEAAQKDAPAGKLNLADLEGLTEEQILALLKTLELEDIMYYLKMAVTSGSRELLVNMLGALNAYMAGLDPAKAMEVAQKAVEENPGLSFGIGKDGKPIVFVATYNDAMNGMINNSDTRKVVSSQSSL